MENFQTGMFGIATEPPPQPRDREAWKGALGGQLVAGLLGYFLPAPLVSVVQAHALCPTGDQPKAFPSLIVLRVAGLLGG